MWERAVIGAVAVLMFGGLIVLAVRWLVGERGRSVAAEQRATQSKEAFDAVQRAAAAEARTRGLTRSQRLDRLLDRSRRRAASRLPRDE